MKRLFALASLALVLSFVSGTSDDPEAINVGLDSRVHLRGEVIEGIVKRCTIEISDGNIYEFYPLHESPGSSSGRDNYCELDIRDTKLSYAGIWTLTTYSDNNKSFSKKFALTVERDVPVSPSTAVQANKGQWATVWFDGNDSDVKECKLKATRGDKEYDLINDDTNEGLSRYRGCGVRMHVEEKRAVQWEFRRKIGDYVIEKSIFQIAAPLYYHDLRERHLLFNLGEPAELKVEDSGTTFCQLTRPDGSLTGVQYGKCSVKINAVTQYHRGIWRASYATRGQMELNHININVQTWDLDAINATQLSGPGPAINLLCRTGIRDLKFCYFVRPDKHVIHLPVGVGNENYSYYGDGYTDRSSSASRRYADCGITIHKPSEIDFGLWHCEMGIGGGGLINDKEVHVRGSVINVVEARAKRTYEVDNPRVYVKRGDQFKIRCTVNALLDYCWLTSPNGTIYSVLPEVVTNTTLKYDGKGFAMGDCGAIVKRANASDDGDWTCHLGISGNAEIEKKIGVQVTDSYLIPGKSIIYNNNKALLSCRTFLGEESTIQYCRWVRPNGRGINQEDSSRYNITSPMMNRCELTIQAVEPEDIGKWTCVAMLAGARKTEEWATLRVGSFPDELLRTNSLISIVLGSGLLIMVLVGSFFVAMYIYRRRRAQGEIKSPPPYDPENYELPRANQIASNQPTLDKDYKY